MKLLWNSIHQWLTINRKSGTSVRDILANLRLEDNATNRLYFYPDGRHRIPPFLLLVKKAYDANDLTIFLPVTTKLSRIERLRERYHEKRPELRAYGILYCFINEHIGTPVISINVGVPCNFNRDADKVCDWLQNIFMDKNVNISITYVKFL